MLLFLARAERQDQHPPVYVVAFSKGCETGSTSCCLRCCVQHGFPDRISQHSTACVVAFSEGDLRLQDQRLAVCVAIFSKGYTTESAPAVCLVASS